MEKQSKAKIQSLSTLQLIAIITVVLGHFWVKGSGFMNSACVAFCFVYSGYFTARRHQFPPEYGIKEHMRFMWSKLAKFYPLHVLGVFLGLFAAWVSWGGGVNLKILLAHLTLTSSWIPYSHYFFGVNPVAWYICDLFFLYLMAPVLVRGLRKLSLAWQVTVVVVLLIAQFTVEACSLLGLYHYYFLYQFPVARLLDFAAGIIIFNITQCATWQSIKDRITPASATWIELASVISFLILYVVGEKWIHSHCYRAFCASAPAIVALFVPFILTSESNGLVSRVMRFRLFEWMSTFDAEIYLLQFGPYFIIQTLLKVSGIELHPVLYFVLQMSALLLVSWLVHRYYVTPLKRKLLQHRN